MTLKTAQHDDDGAASARRQTRIYTVPPGRPFLDVLASAILGGRLGTFGNGHPSPLALTDITLLLPTRRATRALQDAFLRNMPRRAVLLPRIRPISEDDEDVSLLTGLAGLATLTEGEMDARPPISEMERRIVLTQLVLRWAQAMRAPAPAGERDSERPVATGSETPAQAAHLAAELATLMDMVETENASLADLATLVPDMFSEHWQKTIRFLEILNSHWPAYLETCGLTSPAAQRNHRLLAEARRLIEAPPKGPVIVAGVTGSIPASAELMRAVAALPNGSIVLPNLDLTLDEQSWQQIRPLDRDAQRHPEHPQYGLKVLLDRLGIGRQDVALLPGADLSIPEQNRLAFVTEAMRPAATTAHWHTYAETVDRQALTEGLAAINLVDAPSANDEAEAVALIMREALETPGQTAALVSPDRLLARRVATRLESWGIRVDDSAGRPFAKTVPGAFLDLVIEAVHRDFAPPQLTALLKHPLTRLGLGAFEVRRAARALELAAFRADYFGTGLDGVAAALAEARIDAKAKDRRERRSRAVQGLWDADWDGAQDLVKRLNDAFEPLHALYRRREPSSLGELAAAHVTVAEALAALPVEADAEMAAEQATPATGNTYAPTTREVRASARPADDKVDAQEITSPLYRGEAGETASSLFTGLIDPGLPQLPITPADYADLYRSLIVGLNVRPRVPVHPRLSIWGPFEARLQQPDIIILGSLNDGTWPEAADPGAWLNRPMRDALGLPAPEEKIGHAAHDFTSLLGAKRIYLTRAEKIDGVPTVPSRWLMRIVALLDGMKMRDAIGMDRTWLGWARARDHVTSRSPAKPPAPCPPVALRPRRLSVSAVEQWIANPYATFASRILRLEPLPALGKLPDASLKGSVIHDVLATFAKNHPASLPNDVERALVDIARERLAPYLSNPRIRAFWLPRFERFALWFAETEAERRNDTSKTLAEISGSMVLEAPEGPFTLVARADRIDVTSTGLVITDYKTGQVPSDQKVLSGQAPQLPLEAAIAMEGGFAGLDAASVAALCYIRSTGGIPPGEHRTVEAGDVARLATEQVDGLERLIAHFDVVTTPYAALRRPGFSYDYDDFAQLARVAEWSVPTENAAES
ncbi:MAG: double-strand break repair protein AddB [Hyphomicrobiaceae bacterium]